MALLLPSPTHVLFDNVPCPIVSDALAAALTTGRYSDRELGKSRSPEVPVRCIWLATGNNIQCSKEIARRIVRIRIDHNIEAPYLKKDFAIKNFSKYLDEQGFIYRYYALIMAKYWAQCGAPRIEHPFFPAWSGPIGGVLSVCGVPGFLADLQHNIEQLAGGFNDDVGMIIELYNYFGEKLFTIEEAITFAAIGGNLMFDFNGKDSNSKKREVIFRSLAGLTDRVHQGVKFTRISDNTYKCRKVN